MGIIWLLPMVYIPLHRKSEMTETQRKNAIGNAIRNSITTAIENAMVFALVNSHYKGRNKKHCLQMLFDIFTIINHG